MASTPRNSDVSTIERQIHRLANLNKNLCRTFKKIAGQTKNYWGERATRKRKPAHLKFKGHMHACCIYVANASRAITTLIERLHMHVQQLSDAG